MVARFLMKHVELHLPLVDCKIEKTFKLLSILKMELLQNLSKLLKMLILFQNRIVRQYTGRVEMQQKKMQIIPLVMNHMTSVMILI